MVERAGGGRAGARVAARGREAAAVTRADGRRALHTRDPRAQSMCPPCDKNENGSGDVRAAGGAVAPLRVFERLASFPPC